MSLKILIFPACIILSLIVVIGYIKPDIQTALLKRAEIQQKESDLARVDGIIQNIQTLNSEIDARHDTEDLVLKYSPPALDEEHILDIFNFLATQSGVVITQVGAEENQPKERSVAPLVEHASVSFQALVTPTADPNVPVLPTATLQSYKATVTALGSYQSIKDFVGRLYRVDRMHTLHSFSVTNREKDRKAELENSQKGPTYPADFFKMQFDADFPYFSVLKVISALDMGVFQTNTFDFSTAEKVNALVNSPLPTLEVGQVGKPNPFQ